MRSYDKPVLNVRYLNTFKKEYNSSDVNKSNINVLKFLEIVFNPVAFDPFIIKYHFL